MAIPIPINHVEQLKENARTYMHAISNPETMEPAARNTILKTLSTSRSWFTFEENGERFIVPVKFGGYADMTPERYEKYRKTHMHGADGDRACSRVCHWSECTPAMGTLRKLAKKIRERQPHPNAAMYRIEAEPLLSLTVSDQTKLQALTTIVLSTQLDDAVTVRKALIMALA